MATNTETRFAEIVVAKESDPILSTTLTSTSKTAIWRLWAWITAFCMGVLQDQFDEHKVEIDAIIANERPHTLPWYIGKAKAYQHGVSLPADTDVYAVVPPTDEAVLIIEQANAVELVNLVRIKVAKLSSGDLAALSSPELSGFTAYMGRIKDAGVRLQLTSGSADNFHYDVEVFYDPLVLDANGERLDGTAPTPVKDGINTFLQSLPFDGLFILNKLETYLETNVEGVKIAYTRLAEANYAATPYVAITHKYVPDAGYMRLDSAYFDANVTYTPQL